MNIRQDTNINHNYDNFNFWQIDLKELPSRGRLYPKNTNMIHIVDINKIFFLFHWSINWLENGLVKIHDSENTLAANPTTVAGAPSESTYLGINEFIIYCPKFIRKWAIVT